MQLDLSEDERAVANSFGALGRDISGREVYVGLTREESEWKLAYERRYPMIGRIDRPSDEDKRKHIALNESHGLARLSGLGATLGEASR